VFVILYQVRGELKNEDILSIAAGKDFSLAVTMIGNVYAFGGNDYCACTPVIFSTILLLTF
jgi:alpha-tubulin suppressor-like RCC1 family protein